MQLTMIINFISSKDSDETRSITVALTVALTVMKGL